MALEPAGHSRVVLVVEDEPDNQEILRTVVEELLGLEALLAADGETALRLAITTSPLVILMDLMMPVMDGFEAIARLKENPKTASIPVIAVTALSRPTDRQRALDAGADGYLSKPFDIDNLTVSLAAYVDDAENARSAEPLS